jgi:hypothetical protein
MSEKILSVVSVNYDPETRQGSIKAILDDFMLIYPQTYDDPAEYGPGLAEAEFTLEEDDELSDKDEEIISFFEDLYLNWNPIDSSDWDT